MEQIDAQAADSPTDLEEQEEKGLAVAEALAGDAPASPETQELLRRLHEERRDRFFSDLVHHLAAERFPEAQAESLWRDILNHKFLASERLGRNVGVRLAALDYLVNVRGLVREWRVVKPRDFHHTLRMARTDALTGLYNRRYFLEQAQRLLEAAARTGAPVSLMMADLDRFKEFNDTRGHQAGDGLLQEVARLARSGVRVTDVVARYGGDEFCFLLPRAAGTDAAAVAEKIRQKIEELSSRTGVTMSGGLAECPADASRLDDLIAAADELLYRAKEFGGNQVCRFHAVTFRYEAEGAAVRRVSVSGDFNNWSIRSHPMAPLSGGKAWELFLRLKPGRYHYKFLVDDGQWIADPRASEYEGDGFGGRSSVLVVK